MSWRLPGNTLDRDGRRRGSERWKDAAHSGLSDDIETFEGDYSTASDEMSSSLSKPSSDSRLDSTISPNLSPTTRERKLLATNLLQDESDTSSTYVPRSGPQRPKVPPKPAKHRFEKSVPVAKSKLSFTSHRLVVAIDFGTTYTGVAFCTPGIAEKLDLDEIVVIQNWGKGRGMDNSDKIPSVISYSTGSHGEEQWGFDLSPDATVMVNTKLELGVQGNRADEMELILHLLEGTQNLNFGYVEESRGKPDYPCKKAEDILTDYMERIFKVVKARLDGIAGDILRAIPVDIVITVPVDWSYRAMNSTFRAIRAAGFNNESFAKLQDTIMVTEPEAAAIYSARYLKDKHGGRMLKEGEFFILCDAGGGTVDIVSYEVVQLEPILTLQKVGEPRSKKCGSVYIDHNFKSWLRQIIGEEYYHRLDPLCSTRKTKAQTTEGPWMRDLMKQFDRWKKKFAGDEDSDMEMTVDLPQVLNDMEDIEGYVSDGQLIIRFDNMEDFFRDPIDSIIELVHEQMNMIEEARGRVRNLFLVGGFSESPYVQNELKHSLEHYQIDMKRPETSWTAVVRGAAIYGTEKSKLKQVAKMEAVRSSFGIVQSDERSTACPGGDGRDMYRDSVTGEEMVGGVLFWLIRAGDLALSNKPKIEHQWLTRIFHQDSSITVDVYEYPDEQDQKDLPTRFKTSEKVLNEIFRIPCNMEGVLAEEIEVDDEIFYKVKLLCTMKLHEEILHVQVFCETQLVGEVEMNVDPSQRTKERGYPTAVDRVRHNSVRQLSTNSSTHSMRNVQKKTAVPGSSDPQSERTISTRIRIPRGPNNPLREQQPNQSFQERAQGNKMPEQAKFQPPSAVVLPRSPQENGNEERNQKTTRRSREKPENTFLDDTAYEEQHMTANPYQHEESRRTHPPFELPTDHTSTLESPRPIRSYSTTSGREGPFLTSSNARRTYPREPIDNVLMTAQESTENIPLAESKWHSMYKLKQQEENQSDQQARVQRRPIQAYQQNAMHYELHQPREVPQTGRLVVNGSHFDQQPLYDQPL